jgi:hypothetical protein
MAHRPWCLDELGEDEVAERLAAQSADSSFPLCRGIARLWLARRDVRAGRPEAARRLLDGLDGVLLTKGPLPVIFGEVLAGILTLEGKPEEALEALQRRRDAHDAVDLPPIQEARLRLAELRALRAVDRLADEVAIAALAFVERVAAALAFDPAITAGWRASVSVRQLVAAAEDR